MVIFSGLFPLIKIYVLTTIIWKLERLAESIFCCISIHVFKSLKKKVLKKKKIQIQILISPLLLQVLLCLLNMIINCVIDIQAG